MLLTSWEEAPRVMYINRIIIHTAELAAARLLDAAHLLSKVRLLALRLALLPARGRHLFTIWSPNRTKLGIAQLKTRLNNCMHSSHALPTDKPRYSALTAVFGCALAQLLQLALQARHAVARGRGVCVTHHSLLALHLRTRNLHILHRCQQQFTEATPTTL